MVVGRVAVGRIGRAVAAESIAGLAVPGWRPAAGKAVVVVVVGNRPSGDRPGVCRAVASSALAGAYLAGACLGPLEDTQAAAASYSAAERQAS